MRHHPIFGQFHRYDGPRPDSDDVDIDWIGFRTLLTKWMDPSMRSNVATAPDEDLPPLTEEYFEWIDLLEAVDMTQDTFTMLELGAGYGRWGIRGALAARQRGRAARVVLVEAEPQHAAWAREALEINGVAGDVVEAAIAYDSAAVPFTVRGHDLDAANWYGQAITYGGEPTGETYFGHPIHRDQWYDRIFVPAKSLEQVAGDLGVIDFIDADLQTAELEMAVNSIGFLTERVRRVHIGTHSEQIEQTLREIFAGAGWRQVWDFSLGGERSTPFGMCYFSDGVQGWVNPRLAT